MIDLRGSGKPDLLQINADGSATVWPSQQLPDLLQTVNNSLGGTAGFTYTPSSAYTNTYLPFTVQTVSQTQTTDGRGTTSTTSYSYDDGYYYAPDRDFRGFGNVWTTYQGTPQSYASVTQTTFNQDVGVMGALKGTISQQLVTSKEGNTRQVVNTYDAMSLDSGATGCVTNSSTACFPRLSQTVTTITDAGYTPYSYRSAYTYDVTYLNILEEDKYGAASGTTPLDVHTSLVYTSSISGLEANWIVSKPVEVTVSDYQGNIVNRKWTDYDTTTGNPLTEEVCLSSTPATGCAARNPSQNAFTNYTYYPDGNVNTITDPLNHTTTLTYDATLTYVYQKTNALRQMTTTTYNPGTGKIASMVPPHLQGTSYSFTSSYDVLGRISQVNRPDGGYTTYSYNNIGTPTTQYIQQQEYIVGGAVSPIDHSTWTYFDGLGRTYQSCGSGPSTSNICTNTVYDTLGRVSSKTVPYLSGNTAYSTIYTYDGFSRVTNTNIPDVTMTYNVSTSYQGLTKVVTDQNSHTTTSTSDVFGRLASVQDANGTITGYTYDTRNNLLQVVAASNLSTYTNTTTMTHDSMGRKLSMIDPDMGAWSYSYDKGGNLILPDGF